MNNLNLVYIIFSPFNVILILLACYYNLLLNVILVACYYSLPLNVMLLAGYYNLLCYSYAFEINLSSRKDS